MTGTVLDAGAAGRSAISPDVVRRLTRRVVAGPRAATVTTTAPFTGAPLAELPVSTPDDVRVAVEAAHAAQRAWARRPLAERARPLLVLHDLVLDAQDELLDLIQLENGKARVNALEEVFDVAMVARHYGRRASSYLRPRRRAGAMPLITRPVESHHPKGVVGVIAPWNYPLTLAISDALPAIVAGNGVVLKPDTQTALTALRGLELLTQAGVPEGLVQVIVGEGAVVGTALIDAADYVCFTGSTRTGRLVAERAGRRLIGASMELGGKNSLYVADDADLERAAEGSVRACFASTGQLCIGIERLLLHEAVADAFLERFQARVRALRLGAGLDFSADVGSLTSRRQLDVVSRHVEDAVAHGARVLTGGRPRSDIGPLFYEPTVLDGVPPTAECYHAETFGPVASVYRVRGDDEAVALANEGDYGLNASIWTRDVARGRRIAARVVAGTVNVNEAYGPAWGSVAAPMGGMRASGLGRRHGAEGILKYTEAQNVTVQHLMGLGVPAGMTPEKWARTMTTVFRALKRLGAR